MALIAPSPYTLQKPPAGAMINRDHPLAPDVACVPFWEGGGTPQELVTGTPCVPTAVPAWTAGSYGGGQDFNGSTQYLKNTRVILPTRDCSIVLLCRPLNRTQAGWIFGPNSTTAFNQRMSLTAPFSDTFWYWDYGGFAAGQRCSYSPPLSAYGLWHHVVVTASVGGGVAIWFDGVRRAASAGTGGRTASNGPGFWLGAWGPEGAGPSYNQADLALACIYARCLTASEIAQSAAAPYSFFVPQSTPTRRFWLGVSVTPVVMNLGAAVGAGNAALSPALSLIAKANPTAAASAALAPALALTAKAPALGYGITALSSALSLTVKSTPTALGAAVVSTQLSLTARASATGAATATASPALLFFIVARASGVANAAANVLLELAVAANAQATGSAKLVIALSVPIPVHLVPSLINGPLAVGNWAMTTNGAVGVVLRMGAGLVIIALVDPYGVFVTTTRVNARLLRPAQYAEIPPPRRPISVEQERMLSLSLL